MINIMLPKFSQLRLLLLTVVFLKLFSINLQAQGFDWQYSSRLPSGSPTLFWGGTVRAIYALHSADIYSLGDEFHCGDYKTGAETGFGIALSAEYWTSANLAVWGDIGYKNSTATFRSTTAPEPFKSDGQQYSLTREFSLKANFQAIEVQGGAKWRVPKTHFHGGVGVRAIIALKSSAEQTETILTPVEFTQSIAYGESTLSGIRSIHLTPIAAVGYDAELARGIYATPKITVGFPIISRATSISWTVWDFSGGVTILINF